MRPYDRAVLRTIYMLVAYDGTDFHGWQRQSGVRTVQEVLEEQVRRVVREPVNIAGSSRTDAGVHAVGHVDSFCTTCPLEPLKLCRAVGSRLPDDLAVLDVREVHPTFHATNSAVSKRYRYRIHNSELRPVKNLTQRYTYHCWHPLDMEKMRAAGRHFIGEMDFCAMTPVSAVRESMVRRIVSCDIDRQGEEIWIDVEGEGFLYNQVRNMVGTLMEVGRGRWEPNEVADILASRDRTRAGPTAPAHGLCLQCVRYPEHLMQPPDVTPVPV